MLSGLIAALCAALPTLAAPLTVASGSTLTLDFNGFYNNTTIPGLTGEVTLSNFVFTSTTVGGQAATKVTMNYLIENTSLFPVILTSRISNFAFDTTPTILTTGLNQVTGAYDTVVINANQPNGIGTVEVCFTAANCPGGGSGGVWTGDSGGGAATLYFSGNISSFTLDNAVLRYQSVSCIIGSPCNSSASGVITASTGGGAPGGQVPEPSTYALMSLGIAGIAFLSRHTRRG